MAVARCEMHGAPVGSKRAYGSLPVKPVGFPETAAVCGRTGCAEPAMIWLDADDQRRYNEGENIMPVPNLAIKVRVQ